MSKRKRTEEHVVELPAGKESVDVYQYLNHLSLLCCANHSRRWQFILNPTNNTPMNKWDSLTAGQKVTLSM